MAKKTSRPGRTLLIFFLGVAVMYGIVALGGATAKKSDPSVWKPLLGLDLEGGTRITLTAHGQAPGTTKLNEAAGIIRKRVNGNGVTESTVTTQSNKNIVVEIPGKNRQDLVNAVKQTAQLRFRLVVSTSNMASALPSTATPKATTTPKSGSKAGKTGAKNGATTGPQTSPTATPKPRPAPRLDAAVVKPKPGKKSTPSKTATGTPTATPSATPTPSLPKPTAPVTPSAADKAKLKDPLAWSTSPDTHSVEAYVAYVCPTKAKPDPKEVADYSAYYNDTPGNPLVSCDDSGQKFLLSPAIIEGTQLASASSGLASQTSVNYAVDLTFKSSARKAFATYSTALQKNGGQFAIVLDGQVISYAGVTSPILDGNAQITGGFTQASAATLANSLKYGALPIKFNQPTVETIGPSLAGDQLSAGLLAGAVGLLIVMIYCLLYYRGLGVVVVASLLVAGGTTYGAVLVLGKGAGFTLSLPGIAGLIVAVGITADSFIVYFERIRDEMRSGKSMRVAVEAGWVRARNTCLAADSVSLLASVILYIFAIDEVRGFAFALGVSTLIDLAVFFWFTKPMVTLAAKRTFFNSGHRFSGLSPETLGIDGDQTAHLMGGRA